MRHVIVVSLLSVAGCATGGKPQPVAHVAPYESGPAAVPESRDLYPHESQAELRGTSEREPAGAKR
jgi:hypothetical protein